MVNHICEGLNGATLQLDHKLFPKCPFCGEDMTGLMHKCSWHYPCLGIPFEPVFHGRYACNTPGCMHIFPDQLVFHQSSGPKPLALAAIFLARWWCFDFVVMVSMATFWIFTNQQSITSKKSVATLWTLGINILSCCKFMFAFWALDNFQRFHVTR